jgi:hypothetical protein
VLEASLDRFLLTTLAPLLNALSTGADDAVMIRYFRASRQSVGNSFRLLEPPQQRWQEEAQNAHFPSSPYVTPLTLACSFSEGIKRRLNCKRQEKGGN